jgi:hypothetical protein
MSSVLVVASAPQHRPVPAETIGQESRHSTDRGYANARYVVDLSVGELLDQKFHDLPAVNERLQLGGSTEIPEEPPAFIDILQADNSPEQRIFCPRLLSRRVVTIRFHLCTNVLA